MSVKGDFYMPSLIVAIAGSQHTKPKLKSVVSSTKMLFPNIIFKTLTTGSNNISVYIRCEVNFLIFNTEELNDDNNSPNNGYKTSNKQRLGNAGDYEICMVCLLVAAVYRHKSLQFVKKKI